MKLFLLLFFPFLEKDLKARRELIMRPMQKMKSQLIELSTMAEDSINELEFRNDDLAKEIDGNNKTMQTMEQEKKSIVAQINRLHSLL